MTAIGHCLETYRKENVKLQLQIQELQEKYHPWTMLENIVHTIKLRCWG